MNWTEAELAAYLNRGSARRTARTSEKVFQGVVKDIALKLGWRYYHTYNSKRSDQGFPDCVMVRGSRLIFAELKSDTGALSEHQQDWIDKLRVTGAEAYVWRPADIDRILDVLKV